ncbi:MAG: hypothetical protein KTR31_39510 [Myxococcales bacterium]|nr:hypothetical protein [Myxococcales bacterium]
MNRITTILAVIAFSAGCNGPETDTDTTTTDVDTGTPTEQWECDPVGANPEMGGLLNAPLEDDVEVIDKTPAHPGDPGPVGLP